MMPSANYSLLFKIQDGGGGHLEFKKKAIVGAWHHPDLISRGSEDSKTVLTSNTCFFKGVKSGFHLTTAMRPKQAEMPKAKSLQRINYYGTMEL